MYAAHELRHIIWEDCMDHEDECTCSLCTTLDVINEYMGDPP